jgi:hypothetical protein
LNRAHKEESRKQTIYLDIQAEKRRKGNLIVMAHSICLAEGLLDETTLPALESGRFSIENSVIPLLLDEPGTQHEDSMKKGLPN